MIYLFNNNEEMIRIIPNSAIKRMYQTQTLTDENYISDRLDVEIQALNDEELSELEYMAIDDIENPQRFHYYFIVKETTERQTTALTGVQSGIEELRKTPVYDIRPTNLSPKLIADRLLEGTNWQAGYTTNDVGTISTNFYYTDVFSALKKMCVAFGIEMQFFVEITTNRIGARYIEFRKRTGKSVGKRVVYGHNALKIVKEVEKTNTITALIGRGKGVQVSESDEGSVGYGRKIGFENVEWNTSSGAPVDKPFGQEFVEIPDLTLQYGIKNSNGTVRPKIGFVEFQDEESETRLIDRTYNALLELSRPQVLLETSSVYLPDTGIGDTINVVRHDRDLRYQTRVFEITWDRLANRAVDMKLGDRLGESENKRISRISNQVSGNISTELGPTIDELVDRLTTADGKNTNWYTDYDPMENPETMGLVRVNDNWYQPDPEYEGEFILKQWNGEMWVEILRTSGNPELVRRFEEIEQQAQDLADEIEANEQRAEEAVSKAEESLREIGTIDTKVSDLRKDLNTVGDKAESSLEIIGIDGGVMYSKNRRLGSKSQPIQPDGRGLIQHNGEGFELGETYTISMIASCIFDDVITWEERSRTESVPFVREIQYRTDLLPEESFVQRNGINGTATYTWQIELVNGELTGNKTEEVRTNYQAPVNEIFIQGTKVMSDVTFNFDVVPFVPPVDPTSDVTFNFTSDNGQTDEWYATPSVNVSSINRAPSSWRTMSLVDDFGAVGDGVTDDSQALKDALQHSNTEPIRLDVGGSEYEYYIPSNGNNRIENYPSVSKGIVIFGNGAVFAPKNERTIDRHEFYLMQIRAEKNAFVETSGFTLDGKHNPQDMFWWISQGKATRASDLPLQKGISYEGSDNIYIHDMTYRNMYGGYLIKLKNYTNVDIQNVRGYSVGGNDNPDSFGTIVHIDGQPDDSYINIDDMVIHGKKSPLNPAWVSWIGIVIENGTTQSSDANVRLADRNTNIHVTNSEFYDFESLYHIETQAGNIYWNTDNVKARVMNYTIGAGVRGEIKDRSNHMRLDILPFMRKGLSSGLYHTYRERPSNNLTDEHGAYNNFHMYNSIINYLPKEDYVGGVDVHAVSHADSVVANLHNVTLNNVPRWLVANASANLYDTQVNLKQGYNSSYSIFSNPEQFLTTHGTSSYNQAGSWKDANEGSYPPLAVNTGFVAPPLTGMIGDILPPA